MQQETRRIHEYHAEATAFQAKFNQPLSQGVEAQAYVKLPRAGGYFSQRSSGFRLENVISYKGAYTQVAGNLDAKEGHGWATLTTSVIEGLNVLDVITCDRIVAQVGTEHPLEGYVPAVTFLGTRYENFRIAGEPVTISLDLDLLGPKPPDDLPYTRSPEFLRKVAQHCKCVEPPVRSHGKLAGRYNRVPGLEENVDRVECSLVNKVESACPGLIDGNVIDVPNFGLVILGGMTLMQSEFAKGSPTPQITTIEVTMLELLMGCIGDGTGKAGGLITNGHTKP